RQVVLHVGELHRTRGYDEARLELPFRDRRQLAAGAAPAAAGAHPGRPGGGNARPAEKPQAQDGPTPPPRPGDRAAPLEIAEPVLDTLVVVALQRLADGLDFGVRQVRALLGHAVEDVAEPPIDPLPVLLPGLLLLVSLHLPGESRFQPAQSHLR